MISFPGRCMSLLLLFAMAGLYPACAGTLHSENPGRGNPERERPVNVVFILSDDHRYDFMGFHERAPSYIETPHMDRMAEEGAHLQNAFVTTSLCSPSRASILTGRYAHRHQVVDNTSPIPEGTRFFNEDVQANGYRTGFFGKWHMGERDDSPMPGWDRWVSFRGQGVYVDPVLNIDGERGVHEGYTTDILTDLALKWLDEIHGGSRLLNGNGGGSGSGSGNGNISGNADGESRDENRSASESEQPFFLYLSHKAVHAEFVPAERHAGRFRDIRIEYPETMADTERNYRTKPDWVRAQRNSWHGVDFPYHGAMDFDEFYRAYIETLLALDESVGRVLDYLTETGLAENTLVIYMGDNGFLHGEHGLIDKRHAYEESMRVPMLAWAPGMIRPGTEITELVRNIDIAPTILDLTGSSSPEDMDGLSFLPLLRGGTEERGRDFLYEYFWEPAFPHTPTTFALRGERYKYIWYHGVWDRDELYDLQEDPRERYNLAGVPGFGQIRDEMRARLFDELEARGAMAVPVRRAGWQADERRN